MATTGLERISKIWPGIDIPDPASLKVRYDALLSHIEKASALVSGQAAPFATKTLDETLDLIGTMREAPSRLGASLDNMSRETIVAYVKGKMQQNHQDGAIVNAISLGLSLWLTMNIVPSGRPDVGMPNTPYVEWSNDTTLAGVFAKAFPQPSNPPIGKVSNRMTAEFLEAHHGFMVVFTDNLLEHLDITWNNAPNGESAIMVYKHKIFLWNELRLEHVSPLPRKYVEEVLDTLNTLLPHKDKRTRNFLGDRQMREFYALGTCGRPLCRDLSRYVYFGDRLALLSRVADSPLTGLDQVLPGRGLDNFKDSATFWVTVVIITILTVASIVLGAMSYVVSKKSLDLTDRQYRLSLAQACATMNSTQLPGWCP